MGIVMASNVFQDRLSGLFMHLSHMLVYIDIIALIGYEIFEKNLQDVNEVLDIMCNSGMQVNPAKCIWDKAEIEYLNFILMDQGVKPHPKNIKKIQAILPPKNKKRLKQFIGMINYYKDMYAQRKHILRPLISMVGTKSKWICQE